MLHAARGAGLREQVIWRRRRRDGREELIEDAKVARDRRLDGHLLRAEHLDRCLAGPVDAVRRGVVVALRRVRVDVRAAHPRLELALEGVVRGGESAHVVSVAACDLDKLTSRSVAAGLRDAVPLDAVEAGQVHAAKEVIGRVILHVQHHEVVDLVLAWRWRPARRDFAKALPSFFRRQCMELRLEAHDGIVPIVVILVGRPSARQIVRVEELAIGRQGHGESNRTANGHDSGDHDGEAETPAP